MQTKNPWKRPLICRFEWEVLFYSRVFASHKSFAPVEFTWSPRPSPLSSPLLRHCNPTFYLARVRARFFVFHEYRITGVAKLSQNYQTASLSKAMFDIIFHRFKQTVRMKQSIDIDAIIFFELVSKTALAEFCIFTENLLLTHTLFVCLFVYSVICRVMKWKWTRFFITLRWYHHRRERTNRMFDENVQKCTERCFRSHHLNWM